MFLYQRKQNRYNMIRRTIVAQCQWPIGIYKRIKSRYSPSPNLCSQFDALQTFLPDVFPVVIFCHATSSVMTNFIWKAQDMGLTNGEYAFFTIVAYPSATTMTPWLVANISNSTAAYRQKAYYAVKQVIYHTVAYLGGDWTIPHLKVFHLSAYTISQVIHFAVYILVHV